jgi:hypothetical protein
LFGVGQPYNDYSYKDGQYGIYSLGAGGWASYRQFDAITAHQEENGNIYNFSSGSGNKIKMVSERWKNEIFESKSNPNANINKNFPTHLDHGDFKWDREKRTPTPPQWFDTEGVEVVELAGSIFHPEKYYHITRGSNNLKDPEGSDRWKIIQEGRFSRFVSANGYILKIDYYWKYNHFSPNEDLYNLKVDDKNFPSDKYGDPNGYYRSVWAVIPVNAGTNYYFMKNARYSQYFINDVNGKFGAANTPLGDQVQITEAK